MSYLAILGRQPELGTVELESLLGAEAVRPLGPAALISESIELSRLGGCLKLARVIAQTVRLALPLKELNVEPTGTKRNFAVSIYGSRLSPAKLMHLGLELKKQLPGSWRLVAPAKNQLALNSAQLKHNHIPERGFELVILQDKDHFVYALTEQVQDIEAYGQRDYHKPARDARAGMLPPKLAQILINLTGPENLPVWDPFCGTGTVLMESLLMSRPAYGSDLEPSMMQASRQNLEWLAAQRVVPTYELWQADATTARKPTDAVVVASEGFLGAPGRRPTDSEVADLTGLYLSTLTNLARQNVCRVAICLPAAKDRPLLPIIDRLTDVGYTLAQFAHANSERLIYHRPGQVVGRQLLSLRKN